MRGKTQLKAKSCWALVLLFYVEWKTTEKALNNERTQTAFGLFYCESLRVGILVILLRTLAYLKHMGTK